jgi:hypothetical protein
LILTDFNYELLSTLLTLFNTFNHGRNRRIWTKSLGGSMVALSSSIPLSLFDIVLQFYAKLDVNCFFAGFYIEKTLSFFNSSLYFWLNSLSIVKHITDNPWRKSDKFPMPGFVCINLRLTFLQTGYRQI